MGRLAAVLGALLGILLVPLALVAPTAILLLPGHLAFTVLATAGAVGEGIAGRPERARLWGASHLVASIAMVGALELGSRVDGRAYWIVPWVFAVIWGWIPAVVGGLSGWMGEAIRRKLSDRAVRRRHQARRLAQDQPKSSP